MSFPKDTACPCHTVYGPGDDFYGQRKPFWKKTPEEIAADQKRFDELFKKFTDRDRKAFKRPLQGIAAKHPEEAAQIRLVVRSYLPGDLFTSDDIRLKLPNFPIYQEGNFMQAVLGPLAKKKGGIIEWTGRLIPSRKPSRNGATNREYRLKGLGQ